MVRPELTNYIKEILKKGTTQEAVVLALQNQGWKHEDIVESFRQITTSEKPNSTNSNTKVFLTTKKKILISMLLFILLGIGIFFFWPSLYMAPLLKAQFYSKTKDPSLYIYPTVHEINASSFRPEKPKEISHFGISLTTPWGAPTQERKWGTADWVFFYKNPQHSILLSPPNPKSMISIQTISEVNPNSKDFKKVFGADAFSSNYVLYSILYNLNPDNLTIFSSPQQLTKMGIGLPMKQIITLQSPYIYSFNYQDIKGYQIEAKGKSSISKVLTLFDKKDNVYSISISGNLTQEEIDYIISTIKIETPSTTTPSTLLQ